MVERGRLHNSDSGNHKGVQQVLRKGSRGPGKWHPEMLQLEVGLRVVLKDKDGRVWPGCRHGRLWVLSHLWEAEKETRAWIQELGHDS